MTKEPLSYDLDIDSRVEKFRAALEGSEHEEVIVQKYIVHGTPYIFKDDEDKYFDLKREIAAHFSEHYNNVHMTGSAKLGFSIAPHKLWKPFDFESDIDVVIISHKLFEESWKDIHRFNLSLTSRTEREDNRYKRFLKYFFKGWIRPDLFPGLFHSK